MLNHLQTASLGCGNLEAKSLADYGKLVKLVFSCVFFCFTIYSCMLQIVRGSVVSLKNRPSALIERSLEVVGLRCAT